MAMLQRRALVVLAACCLGAACAGCGAGTSPDNGAFSAAYSDHRAAEVTVEGRVSVTLPDSPDRGDGIHQRFDVDIVGVRVEIDHNLSLAGRVPITVGSTVIIHGQFEPDPGHPIIHYTHHATGGHEGGWIDLGGTRYD